MTSGRHITQQGGPYATESQPGATGLGNVLANPGWG
jgi:hypothetical protein